MTNETLTCDTGIQNATRPAQPLPLFMPFPVIDAPVPALICDAATPAIAIAAGTPPVTKPARGAANGTRLQRFARDPHSSQLTSVPFALGALLSLGFGFVMMYWGMIIPSPLVAVTGLILCLTGGVAYGRHLCD